MTTKGGPLAIDLGEWFHDPLLRAHVSPRHWRRLAPSSERAFAAAELACAARGVTATWLVPRALPSRCGAQLRALADAGHEIGLAAAPLALADDAGAADRERAVRTWLDALHTIEDSIGRPVRGAGQPSPAGRCWHDWLAAAQLDYGVVTVNDGSAKVRTLAGEPIGATVFAAWRLDGQQPRLVGLPRRAFAAHYDQLQGSRGWLERLLATHGGTIAAALPPAGIAAPRRAGTAAPAAAATASATAAIGTASRPTAPQERTPAVGGAVSPVAAGARVPRLAVIVPMKDEADGVASLAVELADVARQLADVAACELVLVDDGSTDRTWDLLREHFAAWPRTAFVRHERNQGVAAAIRSGLAATDAELCASIDADLSYDPLELRPMLAALHATGADVVTASPYHPRGGVRNVPRWRLGLSRTLSAAYRLLLRSPVRTWTACFRVYRRAAVAGLPLANPGFLGTAEWLVRVLRRGGRVAEHPCVLEARLFGFSKMRVLRTIAGHARLLVQVALRRVR